GEEAPDNPPHHVVSGGGGAGTTATGASATAGRCSPPPIKAATPTASKTRAPAPAIRSAAAGWARIRTAAGTPDVRTPKNTQAAAWLRRRRNAQPMSQAAVTRPETVAQASSTPEWKPHGIKARTSATAERPCPPFLRKADSRLARDTVEATAATARVKIVALHRVATGGKR